MCLQDALYISLFWGKIDYRQLNKVLRMPSSFNGIWVMVDRFTKTAWFIPITKAFLNGNHLLPPSCASTLSTSSHISHEARRQRSNSPTSMAHLQCTQPTTWLVDATPVAIASLTSSDNDYLYAEPFAGSADMRLLSLICVVGLSSSNVFIISRVVQHLAIFPRHSTSRITTNFSPFQNSLVGSKFWGEFLLF